MQFIFLVMNGFIQIIANFIKGKKRFLITVILLFLLSICIQLPDYVPFPSTKDYNYQIKGSNGYETRSFKVWEYVLISAFVFHITNFNLI